MKRAGLCVRTLAGAAALLPLGGCGGHDAPSYVIVGAYFPEWMLCALIGVVGGIGARSLLVATGLADALPLQLFVCAAIGLIIAIGAWLLLFGR